MHSDAFMYVPHCQFVAGSWHSHNFIRTGRIHVPVHATLGNSIDEVTIDYQQPWRRKTFRTIEMTYGKFPYFKDYWPEIKWILEGEWDSLAALNMNLTEELLGYLECDKFMKCIYSSRTASPNPITEAKDPIDMLIAMCKATDSDEYLSNSGARAYVTPNAETRMAAAGIRHRWFDFADPNYGQGQVAINEGRLSVLDILFTRGPQAAEIIKKAGKIA